MGPAPTTAAPCGRAMAYAMQLAIALLTAGLDSPELEAWVAARSLRSIRTAWWTS